MKHRKILIYTIRILILSYHSHKRSHRTKLRLIQMHAIADAFIALIIKIYLLYRIMLLFYK